ncbi:MAG: TPM domain-containing protein [Alphaproteobacteria bacterium]|nr:TPM domain-containing protein [Alphaproteobacteria bacterium]
MLLCTLGAWAIPVGDVPNPRRRDAWITDLADVLPPDVEASLDVRLAAIERDLGAEVAVVTVPSADGEVPKAYATALFNRWGIGKRGANNGLLVLLVMDARRLEMETGYGLEPVLPDSWLGGMQQRLMVPAFKEGRFGDGVVAGVEAVDVRLRASPDAVREGTRSVVDLPTPGGGRWPVTAGQLALAGGGTLGLFGLGVAARRRWIRQRTCPTCEIFMPMLSEAEEDAHLDSGQQKEEAIGSVEWQVHECPQCHHVRSFARNRWFSGYSACPKCKRRTRSTSTRTLQSATQYSGGLEQIDEQCANCSYSASYTRSTPPLPPPSSDSSSSSSSSYGSSGGSFGGGSSGGGGAGSSW